MFSKGKKKQVTKIGSLLLSSMLAVSILPASALGEGTDGAQAAVEAQAAYTAKAISLSPGSDVSQVNFAWYSSVDPAAAVVQMAKASDLVNGTDFPAADKILTFSGTTSAAVTGFNSNKVTATGLEPNTQYAYRFGDGTDANWSAASNYKTPNPDSYTFMYVGDPQIGASGNAATDGIGWQRTMRIAKQNFPNIDFVMSGGDQVDTGTSEAQYDLYLSPDQLKNIPVATTVGNHDTNINYQYHYNVPNLTTLGGQKVGNDIVNGDYSYTYGDALYMVLNSNSSSTADHAVFMRQAVADHPDTKWRFVTLHHDIYGAGSAHSQSDSLDRRLYLQPVIDELDIDLVFTGHDHSYARSYPLYNNNVQTQFKDGEGNDINPTGTSYFTANSASGSKYYDLAPVAEYYSEARIQHRKTSFSTVTVTPTTFTYDTYEIETDDSLTKIDSYNVLKKPEDAKVYAKAEDKSSVYYAIKNANAVKDLDVTFKFDSAKAKFKEAALTTPDAGSFVVDSGTAGEVNIKATLANPIHTVDYADVIKLTFEAPTGQKSAVTNVELTKSNLTTLNKHKAKVSTVEANTAPITVTNQPNVKVYAKKSTIIAELANKAEFYLALSNTDDVNALDVTFRYDSTKFKLLTPELIGQDDDIQAFDDTNGTVRFLAGFTKPITSEGYTDVVKLTLEPLSVFNRFLQADIELDKVSTASKGINTEVLNNAEDKTASILMRTYKDLVDVNEDTKADVGDLSFATEYYRLTSADTNWPGAKRADVVEDSVIDTADLTLIMNHILH
ncbi:metallophosphoesterase [Paenibacillus sp. MWE-103]|uniref:Metallophosphoesterase n=1 Tax=Paenibacillus artemisiicola TaxID=1172618 RepID=A0ABS3W9S8_9BACL|nr:metallophosphoesterase [Paenibacillus artemisiicola]MBO7745053.1 metallophosphoesterase [Paenibacillus artemisiicola]